jgi:hypothetical protein
MSQKKETDRNSGSKMCLKSNEKYMKATPAD